MVPVPVFLVVLTPIVLLVAAVLLAVVGAKGRRALQEAAHVRERAGALADLTTRIEQELKDNMRAAFDRLAHAPARVTVVVLGRPDPTATRQGKQTLAEANETDAEEWFETGAPWLLAWSAPLRPDESTRCVLYPQVELMPGAVVLCVGGLLETVEAGGRVACVGLSTSPFFVIPFRVKVGATIACGVVRS